MGFEYNNKWFIYISLIVTICLTGSFILITINIVSHINTQYSYFRKRPLLNVYFLLLITVPLLYLSLWLYPYCEGIFILIQIILSACVFNIYVFIKDSLVFYASKYLQNNPTFLEEHVKDGNIRKIMLEHKYPFHNASMCHRVKLTELYVAY